MLFHGVMTADRKFATTSYDVDVSPALTAFMREGWAQDPVPPTEPAEVAPYTAKRRAALSAAFPGKAIVVPAGKPKIRNDDTFYPFRPSSDFVWLTGETAPDAVLVMTPDADSPGVHVSTLYLRAAASRHESAEFYRDRNHGELWTGRRRGIIETAATLGLPTRPLDEFESALQALASSGTLVLRGADSSVDAAVSPNADDAALATMLSDLRLVKDDWELAQLAEAVDATVRGFEDVVRELGAARKTSERWIEGTFWRRARVEGNGVGYSSIAAAGEHATVLHWTQDDGPVRDGDLLLLDAGVEHQTLYTADVTRTIPINGRFSEPQRRVYQLLYDAQSAAMAAVKPGARFRDYFRAASEVLARGLVEWGILPTGAEDLDGPQGDLHRRFTLHGTGHMLGLDVHDCSKARKENYHEGTLQVGYVLTVEPGLYFQVDDLTVPEELRGIGVRIEDDVVVTQDGCRNLSEALPRDPDAVEAWMARLLP
ncbi:MAG: Xaa-Pro aminopeptidase [Actinomycetota bacterium]|nr:Xaa-Pro aminopeptidase [Actinomycetota bacterium]